MPTIAIAGTDLVLETRPDEAITATFRRAGLALRDGCLRGGCGICRVTVESGQVELCRTVCEQALPQADRDRGITLACRAVPVDDVVITVPPEGKFHVIAPLLTRLAMAGNCGAEFLAAAPHPAPFAQDPKPEAAGVLATHP